LEGDGILKELASGKPGSEPRDKLHVSDDGRKLVTGDQQKQLGRERPRTQMEHHW